MSAWNTEFNLNKDLNCLKVVYKKQTEIVKDAIQVAAHRWGQEDPEF
jgi:hypothetical protein